MTNEDRADRAQAALDAYIEYTGDTPDESHFRDLLSDLMHLADRDGAGEDFTNKGQPMSFDKALDVARFIYSDELNNPDG